MAKKFVEGTELVQEGFANGISLQLAKAIKENGTNAQISS